MVGQMSEASAHHEPQGLNLLAGSEGVRRATVRPTSTVIRMLSAAPALDRSSRYSGDFACRAQPGTPRLSFADGTED
jgi:hypothetical protein